MPFTSAARRAVPAIVAAALGLALAACSGSPQHTAATRPTTVTTTAAAPTAPAASLTSAVPTSGATTPASAPTATAPTTSGPAAARAAAPRITSTARPGGSTSTHAPAATAPFAMPHVVSARPLPCVPLGGGGYYGRAAVVLAGGSNWMVVNSDGMIGNAYIIHGGSVFPAITAPGDVPTPATTTLTVGSVDIAPVPPNTRWTGLVPSYSLRISVASPCGG